MSQPKSNPKPHIRCVADDQADVLEAVRLLLKGHGFDVDTVPSPSAALAALERRDYDAMLLDMNFARDTTSGKEGLDLSREAHHSRSSQTCTGRRHDGVGHDRQRR